MDEVRGLTAISRPAEYRVICKRRLFGRADQSGNLVQSPTSSKSMWHYVLTIVAPRSALEVGIDAGLQLLRKRSRSPGTPDHSMWHHGRRRFSSSKKLSRSMTWTEAFCATGSTMLMDVSTRLPSGDISKVGLRSAKKRVVLKRPPLPGDTHDVSRQAQTSSR